MKESRPKNIASSLIVQRKMERFDWSKKMMLFEKKVRNTIYEYITK